MSKVLSEHLKTSWQWFQRQYKRSVRIILASFHQEEHKSQTTKGLPYCKGSQFLWGQGSFKERERKWATQFSIKTPSWNRVWDRLDFKYFKLSISIGDNLFKFLNLEIIAWIVLCVCVCLIPLKEFISESRCFTQVRVTMNNKRVSSGQVFFFGLISSLCSYFLVVGGFSSYM